MNLTDRDETDFNLTDDMRLLLDGFVAPGAKSKSLLAPDRKEKHVDGALAFINQALAAEACLYQKLVAFPAIDALEDEQAVEELSKLIGSHLNGRLGQRQEIPLYQHLDEILDALAGPVVLTTDALRRFFHLAAKKLLPILAFFAKEEKERRQQLRAEEFHALRVPESIEQVKKLFQRFRAKDICLKDILESAHGADILFTCIVQEIECQDDARIMLQMHLLSGCTAVEIAEYFKVRDVRIVKRILRESRKKLCRKAIEAAKKEPGFNSSYTI